MIQMKSGVYGAKSGMIRPEDGPFSLSEKEEARLVARGVAKYVNTVEVPVNVHILGVDEEGNVEYEADIECAAQEPAISEGMTTKQLREIGKEYGLTFKVGMSKSEMVAAIKACWPQPIEAEPEPEDAEEVVPEEEAPVFDAVEAVL